MRWESDASGKGPTRAVIQTTDGLEIRPFERADLPHIHRILLEAFGEDFKADDADALADRDSWLQWSAQSMRWYPRLKQTPYGDLAVVLRDEGSVIGSVGFVPCLDRFEQIPSLRGNLHDNGYKTPEVGLFWAIDPRHQRRGFATEAGLAMIEFAFSELQLSRIIASTEYKNDPSIGVMRKLGMRIERNPGPDSPWLQIVGIRDNPASTV